MTKSMSRREGPIIVLGLVGAVAMAMATATPGGSARTVGAGSEQVRAAGTGLQPHPADHRVPTIDGAVTPERIPDDLAYRMFLRMAANPDQRAARAYIRYILSRADVNGAERELDWSAADQIVRIVNDHAMRLQELELSMGELSEPTVLERRANLLASFQEKVAAGIGAGGARILHDAIEQRVKPKIRVFSKPD